MEPEVDDFSSDGTDDEDFGDEESYEPTDEASGNDGAQQKRKRTEEIAEEPVNKSAKLDKPHLYKLPTADELMQLTETENLYNSSLFKLQIDELLNEVLITDKKRQRMGTYAEKLKSFLLALPDGDKHQLKDTDWLASLDAEVPMRRMCRNEKGHFKFQAPSAVHDVGSFSLKTCVKPDHHMDLAVNIPESFFEDKDHLDERYSYKRALYLAVLASHLSQSDLVSQVKYTYHHGNCRQPILVLTPAGDHCRGFTVHIHTAVTPGVLRLNRLHVNKNNIRRHTTEHKEGTAEPPTPHYNTTVLHDLALLDNTDQVAQSLADCDGLLRGVALLKVWLHQRGLDQGHGNVGSFLLTAFVVYLLNQRKLSRAMSCYQVVRNTFIQLGVVDLTGDGISLCTSHSATPLSVDFQKHFDFVFVDFTGHLNLCAGLSKASYNRLRHEARLGVEMLSDSGTEGFDALFMTPVPFHLTFDHTFHLKELPQLKDVVKKRELDDALLDHHGDTIATSLPHIMDLITKSLGQRVTLVGVKTLNTPHWSLSEAAPEFSTDNKTLTFGVLLDINHSGSVLNKGPSANTPEAEEFRDFWGDKSDLRRFKDGSICEAVVWSAPTSAQQRMVFSAVIQHILHRHADIPPSSLSFNSAAFDALLTLPAPGVRHRETPYGTGEEALTEIHRVFDELRREVRRLDDLPLTITSLIHVSPAARYTEVFPARDLSIQLSTVDTVDNRDVPVTSDDVPTYVPTLDVLCTLERHNKWPEDLEAVLRLKSAFLIRLAEDIRQISSELTTVVANDHILVAKCGFVFRLELAYQREITLSKMVTTPEGLVKMVDNDKSKSLEKRYRALPKLTSTLHGLHQVHPTFGGAVRLAKRWVASQLLLAADHLPEEAVELMVAHLYLHPHPYAPPSSPSVGFLRFLSLLCSHDWQNSPLIVNLNDDLTKADIASIYSNFTKNRAELPIMFIATPSDRDSSLWTSQAPSSLILQRCAELAHQARTMLLSQMEDITAHTEFKKSFRASYKPFDVLIRLKNSLLPRHYQAVSPYLTGLTVPWPVSNKKKTRVPVVNFDPAQFYLQELKEAYGHLALFFHDTYGGCVIGVVWKPQAAEPHEFKVRDMAGRMVHAQTDSPQLASNTDAILEDFKVLGAGLVSLIEVT